MSPGLEGLVRYPSDDDIDYLSASLRHADLQEIAAASGESPWEVIRRGRAISSECKVGISASDNNPFVIWGVVPVPGTEAAAIWMLATPEIETNAMLFLRRSRDEVDELNKLHDVLFNYVDARNALHIKWLRWVGCQFIRRHERHGVEQRPFLEFIRTRKH